MDMIRSSNSNEDRNRHDYTRGIKSVVKKPTKQEKKKKPKNNVP